MKDTQYQRLLPNGDHRITHLAWRESPFCDSGVVSCKIKFERTQKAVRFHMVEDFPEYFQKLALLREQFVATLEAVEFKERYRWQAQLSKSELSTAWANFTVRPAGRGFHVAITLADCSSSMCWLDCVASKAKPVLERTIAVLDKHIDAVNTIYRDVAELIGEYKTEPVC